MMNPLYETCANPARRHDFLLVFDVTDGNPNGDPDAGNMPRIDPETAHGLVTDVCLKRKIRNYVALDKEYGAGFDIYVKEKAILSLVQGRAYEALGLSAPAPVEEGDVLTLETPTDKKAKKPSRKADEAKNVNAARDWMCENFFDIRLFGAVMSLKENNAGQVRGPVQLTFARSIDPIASLEVAITRMAVATEREADSQGGDNRTIGRKALVPYGLYVAKGFFSPSFAKQTKVTEADLILLWDALQNMFEVDRSAARGLMSCRGLYIFTHADERGLGNAPAHKLFDTLEIQRKSGVESPRRFEDYVVSGPRVPDGVSGITLSALVEG